MKSELLKIAIIDDHDLFREGLSLVLNQIEAFEVIFSSGDGNLFLEFICKTKPDVVLMDINMPIIDGVQTTQKALSILPNLNIIALSMFDDVLHYTQMINAGVKGFVQKKATKFELQQAINEVSKGGNFFSQEILQKLAFQSIHFSNNPNHLTNREYDILNLVCNGLTSKEIADKLFINIKTVEVHRTNIFSKANVRNSAELIIWAIKNNIFSIK
ncbi:MAG: response regulator transcription factor [Ignavibacteriaceae bacterium]